MNNNTIAEKLVTDFEEELAADGKSAKTLESYIGDIRGFIEWLDTKESTFTGNLKRFHITAYRSFLVQKNYEVNTINKKINSLQSFNQFLINKGYLKEQVVDLRKDKVKIAAGSEHEVEVFIDVETEKLLFYIQSEEVTSRDRLIPPYLLHKTSEKRSRAHHCGKTGRTFIHTNHGKFLHQYIQFLS